MTGKTYLTKRELEVHFNEFCDTKSLKQNVSRGDVLLSGAQRVNKSS